MSDCNACLIGDDSGEYAEVFERSNIKKSRKPHKCCECRREIPIGNGYESTFTVYEGDAERFATCLICVEIRDTYYCADESVPTVGGLWEDIANEEFFAKFTTGCLNKLKTPEAKTYMVQRWQRWKGLSA